jgi:hypothetical protein
LQSYLRVLRDHFRLRFATRHLEWIVSTFRSQIEEMLVKARLRDWHIEGAEAGLSLDYNDVVERFRDAVILDTQILSEELYGF